MIACIVSFFSKQCFNDVPDFNDHLSFCSCSRSSFYRLCALIGPNPLFTSTGRKPQRDIKFQLATYLHHHGGMNCNHLDTIWECGVSMGSYFNYIDRVTLAIHQLRSDYVQWPQDERQQKIWQEFGGKGFPGAIGVADGCMMRLAEAPQRDMIAYYTRKKCYRVSRPPWYIRFMLNSFLKVSTHATVDNTRHFMSYSLGWPGNQPDLPLLKSSSIWTEWATLFDDSEYLLVDKGAMLGTCTNTYHMKLTMHCWKGTCKHPTHSAHLVNLKFDPPQSGSDDALSMKNLHQPTLLWCIHSAS